MVRVSASKYVVAVVDFSQYGQGEGAGITVFKWPRVVSASAKVAIICSMLARRLGPGVKSVKLSLYGFHRREHEELLRDFLKMVSREFVKMVLRGDLQVVAMPNPDVDKLLYMFEKHEVKVAVFDTPSGREGDYVKKARDMGVDVATGKTHLVSLSDIDVDPSRPRVEIDKCKEKVCFPDIPS